VKVPLDRLRDFSHEDEEFRSQPPR
jgi:hypothetical protein